MSVRLRVMCRVALELQTQRRSFRTTGAEAFALQATTGIHYRLLPGKFLYDYWPKNIVRRLTWEATQKFEATRLQLDTI